MKGFIEITEGKGKTLIAISEIKAVLSAKNGKAVIFLKEYYRPSIFDNFDLSISSEESYSEVVEKIRQAVE